MTEQTGSAHEAAEAAIQQLCRATLARPRIKPADVDTVVAHLAAAAAALSQASRQLSDILDRAADDYVLEMDTLTETVDPTWQSAPPSSISTMSKN